MVFMGGNLRRRGRGGFSNPDRSGELYAALAERAAKSVSRLRVVAYDGRDRPSRHHAQTITTPGVPADPYSRTSPPAAVEADAPESPGP
jgi:hypothetical protein